MKKYFLIISTLFLIGTSAYGQFNLGSSSSDSEMVVSLGDVIPPLKSFEGNKEIDGIGKSVVYDKIGEDSYDNIFYEAAKLNATVKQLNFFTAQTKNNPDFFVDGVGLEFKNSVSKMLTSMFLEDLMKQSSNFSGRLKQLNPKDDFTGLKASKVLAATTGIKNALSNLDDGITGLKELIVAEKGNK